MGTNSKIGWTDHTWNPWFGCTSVSPGCDHCYMMRDLKRYGIEPGVVHLAKSATFRSPLSKRRDGSVKWPDGDKVFTCSWSDFFHPDADEYRDRCWEIIKKRPGLTFQILTKRPDRIIACLPHDWGDGYPNVWLGATAENQEMLDKRLPILLLHTPAAKRFISIEPMLEEVSLKGFGGLLDWVIVGGETGPGCRAINPDWVRSLRDYCFHVDVPLFVKQLRQGKPIPEDLRIYDFPRERKVVHRIDPDATLNRKLELLESDRRRREVDLQTRVVLLPKNDIRELAFASLTAIGEKYEVKASDARTMRNFARARVAHAWDKEADT